MDRLETIFDHYGFTSYDRDHLFSLRAMIEENADDCIEFLHKQLRAHGTEKTTEILDKHPRLAGMHRKWLVDMFSGEYGRPFFDNLKRIGKIHMKQDVSPHSVSVSMNYVRGYLIDLLSEIIDDRALRTTLKASVHKMLDINLDIITTSYVEEEIQTLSAGYRVKSALIGFAERFSGGMNLVLVLALILITLGVVGMFFYEALHLFEGDNVGHGIITVLGTLLILWVMIELMNTEIAHLKGGKFNISVFIGVALVTFIRDLMIATLQHEGSGPSQQSYYLVGVILVLGVVYWLVVRSENRK